MKNIILIAAPAAGKGTEANLIKEEYNIPHISTGDLLRNATKSDDPKFLKVKEVLAKGELVSDDIVVELLKDRITKDDCSNGYILDGFPRNIDQAIIYENMLKELNKDIGIVIVIDLDKKIAKSRISGRVSCPKCGKVYNTNIKETMPKQDGICDDCKVELVKRSDDNADTYEERYNSYVEKTQPLIDYYNSKNVLYHVDGSSSKEITHEQVKKILGSNVND